MYKEKKILGIIPARSGSKGIKDKNIKMINGKPLIHYTIKEAINSNIFDDIIVSTDSEKYKKISEFHGAKVPFLRKKELATDESPTNKVILDAIYNMKKRGKEYDYFILLQPTSPLRKSKDIINAIDLLIKSNNQSCISICEIKNERYLENTLSENLSMNKFLQINNEKSRRQDIDKLYKINGAIYISEIENYIQTKSFYGEKSIAYIMEGLNSIDVDNKLEFEFVKFIIEKSEK